MSLEKNLRLTEEMTTAYNSHDLDLNVTYWADEEAGLARKDFQKNFWLVAFPDTNMETITTTAQGDIVVTESLVTATHLGPLKFWVTEPIPATGNKIEFRLCNVAQWENGKLVDLRGYMSPATILTQLGLKDNIDWDGFM